MKLFTWFASGGFHTSIISTFGIDFEAYEAIALPRLREAGCNNNIVVADARMLSQALSEEARRPKFAGRRYSVIGAQAAGVFHPKVILQLGKASGRLLVGSANMTAAGVAGNLEVVGEVSVAEGNMAAAPLLRAAFDYLMKFVESGSVARRQVDWALKRTRWMPAIPSAKAVVELQEGMRLAFLPRNDRKGIAEHFVEFVGDRAVQVGLGDLFVDGIKRHELSFLIETHSEHLVMRLQRRLREQMSGEAPSGVEPLNPSDVSFVYLGRDAMGCVTASHIGLTPQGKFDAPWPNGFFSERAAEVLPSHMRSQWEARRKGEAS